MKTIHKALLILILLTATSCAKKEEIIYTEKPKEVTIETVETVDVYSEINLFDLITINNATISSENKKINTSTIGIKTIEIFYKVNNLKYIYKFNINIVDTVAPIVLSGTSKTVELNHEKDLCNLIMFGDNYDKKARCTITGDYDLSKTGTYYLKYIIKDQSNNETEFSITLTVIPKSSNNIETPKTLTPFSEIYNNHKTENTEIGLDLSKWQETVDYEEIKKAGVTFVMLRIGVQKSVPGELEMDTYYLENIKKAKEAGLKVGVYLYSIATSKEESITHAKWVIEKLDGTKLDMPIVFDWESWNWWNELNLSFYEINDIADSFLKTVEESGYDAMLYSSKYYLENIWENKLDYPVWLAHYTKQTNYTGKYVMWQLTDSAKIPGVKNAVDVNVLYK